jgi:lysyl-tRNA synthetase class 2
MNPPYTFAHSAHAGDLQTTYSHLSDGEESGATVNVAGRVMLLRTQGKLAFATMRDATGEIQLFALQSLTRGVR